jgi:ATP-dependent RNA helicase DeaD
VVVLDEADEMLDMGFREDLEALLGAAPAERRTLMFSATIPKPIAALAKQYQRHAVRISTTGDDEPHGDIEYRAALVLPRDREFAVVNLLLWHDARGALVFCQTREAVTHLHANLVERGFACVALSGELTQAERTRALHALRDGRARVCVATDVAARGLDLPDLDLVIHADPPRDREVLLHRSGRTGRAGRKGTTVVLVPAPMRRAAERIFASARIRAAWSAPPSADEIRARSQARFVGEVQTLARDASEEETAAARTLLAERTTEEIAIALVRLHRAQGPAPEELVAPRADADVAPVWFRTDVGRAHDADPRWLIPMLCKRGRITKAEIGAIRIGPRETRFEIAAHAAERFETTFARSRGKERIARVRDEPAASPRTSRGARGA